MPELPEVETIKNYILPLVKNKTISSVEVRRKSIIKSDLDNFINALKNQTILDITRKGKYMFFHLSNDFVIISHLRMEGKFFYLSEKEADSKHARVIFYFTNSDRLIFDDSRTFGMLKLSNENKYLNEKEIQKLGDEPFDIKDIDALINKINKTANVKSVLLDQTIMSGIGNIYADEILYKTRLNPNTKAKDISKDKWEEIVKEAVEILNDSIKANGSTIKSYHPAKDKSGSFQNKLNVYGKKGERCPYCNSVFKKTVVASRGTTYCPLCQRPLILKVALTGPSGCGKSTVLSHLKSKGFKVISADEVVKKLYKNPEFAQFLGEKLHIPFKNEVDKDLLKEFICKDEKNKKLIEKLVHPLVKNEIEKEIMSAEDIIIVEVPLLFESHMEDMFDIIIAITSTKQEEMLNKREGLNASLIKKINANNKFESYKNRVDFIIHNNSSLEDLYSTVDDIFNKLTNLQN